MADDNLESIYRKNRQAMFTLALSITRCESSAEDCIQQAFLKVDRKNLAKASDPTAYVFRCVRNSAIDTFRKQNRQAKMYATVFNGYVPPAAKSLTSPDEDTLTAERDQILRSAIEQLDEKSRQIVLLKSFSELTYHQIGHVMDIPEKTAATMYRRALISLHEKLKGQL